MRIVPLMIVTLSLIVPASVAAKDGPGLEITEWPVPWEATRPRDPYVAADGKIWFVGQAGHYVASFDPDTGAFARFDLEDGAGPHTVIVTRDQEIWYAGNRAAHLGRLDPATGEITKVPTPTDRARDPHTMDEDSQGRIWFTSQGANHIGRYDRKTGELELVAAHVERARPYGLLVDENDDAWVVTMGTNALYRVDGDTFELETISLPRSGTLSRRLALAHGKVWYADYALGYLGAYDPQTGEIQEWRTPGADASGPYAVTVDHMDRIWFVETSRTVNRFVGFDPERGEFFGMTDIPSGAGAVRHMVFDPETHSIWFGTDTNNLGRAVVR